MWPFWRLLLFPSESSLMSWCKRLTGFSWSDEISKRRYNSCPIVNQNICYSQWRLLIRAANLDTHWWPEPREGQVLHKLAHSYFEGLEDEDELKRGERFQSALLSGYPAHHIAQSEQDKLPLRPTQLPWLQNETKSEFELRLDEFRNSSSDSFCLFLLCPDCETHSVDIHLGRTDEPSQRWEIPFGFGYFYILHLAKLARLNSYLGMIISQFGSL